MVDTTITVSKEVKELLDLDREGMSWSDYFKKRGDSLKSLREKHIAADRDSRENKEINKRLNDMMVNGERRIREAEKNVDSNVRKEVEELRKEVTLLRELLKLKNE